LLKFCNLKSPSVIGEAVSGAEGTAHGGRLGKSLSKTGCSQLLPECCLQKHPCQSKAARGRKMKSRMH